MIPPRTAVVRGLLSLLTGLLVSLSASAAEKLVIARGDDYRFDLSSTRGLRLRFRDPDLEFRIGGRLHADAALFDDDTLQIDDDAEIRRGRLYLAGRIVDDFRFKVEYDFAPRGPGWRNVWARYQPTRRMGFAVGNFVAPFGLEDVASSNHSTFLERSVSGALTSRSTRRSTPSRSTGPRCSSWSSGWTWAT